MERFTGLIIVSALAVGALPVRPTLLHQPLVAVTVARDSLGPRGPMLDLRVADIAMRAPSGS
jgi:hypothetical protein